MAYGRRTRSSGYRRSGGSRSRYGSRATGRRTAAPRRRAAASRSSRGGRQQTVRLVIEQVGASTVARPASYLSAMNPAVIGAAKPKKARL